MQDLPLEIIYHLATFLEFDSADLGSLMRTCRHVSFAVEYLRYTSIVLFGESGIRLMTTLLSGTPTSMRYCKRVKCLWFRGWNDTNVYLYSTLLGQVLVRLDNLLAFWMESTHLDVDQLLVRLKHNGVARTRIHPSELISDIARGERTYSRMSLPNLRVMRLTGEPTISALVHNRPLKELDLNFFLQPTHLAEFITAVEGSILQDTLETLCIKIARIVDMKLAFPILARVLPAISRLSLEQSIIDFEVRDILPLQS